MTVPVYQFSVKHVSHVTLKIIQTFSVHDVHKQGYPCQYIYGITAVMKALLFSCSQIKDVKIILAYKYFVF